MVVFFSSFPAPTNQFVQLRPSLSLRWSPHPTDLNPGPPPKPPDPPDPPDRDSISQPKTVIGYLRGFSTAAGPLFATHLRLVSKAAAFHPSLLSTAAPSVCLYVAAAALTKAQSMPVRFNHVRDLVIPLCPPAASPSLSGTSSISWSGSTGSKPYSNGSSASSMMAATESNANLYFLNVAPFLTANPSSDCNEMLCVSLSAFCEASCPYVSHDACIRLLNWYEFDDMLLSLFLVLIYRSQHGNVEVRWFGLSTKPALSPNSISLNASSLPNTAPMSFWLPPIILSLLACQIPSSNQNIFICAFSGMWNKYSLTEASCEVVSVKTGLLHMRTPSPPPYFFQAEARIVTVTPPICLEMSSFDTSDKYSSIGVHVSKILEHGCCMFFEIHLVSSLVAEAYAMRPSLCTALTFEFSTLKVLSNISTLIRAITGNLQSKEIIGIEGFRVISSGFASVSFPSSLLFGKLCLWISQKALQASSSVYWMLKTKLDLDHMIWAKN